MLEIKSAKGLTLQLEDNQRLTIEINSTIFDTNDVIRGSYSYPFKFGLNENNRRFIDNGHLPESPLIPDMQVMVTAGAHSFVATLTYKTQGSFADAALLIDLGELADKIRNVPVREFVTERFFISTDETRPATMIKLATAEPNTFPVVFPPFHNSEMVEEGFLPTGATTYKRPTIINKWLPGFPLPSHTGALLGSGEWLMVPMVYVGWLISYICTKLGFTASGTLFTDPLLNRLIIFNTQTMPGMDVLTGGYTVEVGRHLGDYSISEFFKSLRSYIGLSIDINVTSRKAVFNTYKSLVEQKAYVDLSDQVVPGTDGVEKSTTKGFNIKIATDSTDKYIRYHPYPFDSNNIQPKELKTSFSFTVGSKEDDISLSVGTLRMDNFKSTSNITTGPDWLLAAAQQPGNLADPFFEKAANYSPYFDANDPDAIPPAKNPWSLRMLIYWGLKEDTSGWLYPYASSVSYDSKYKIFGGLSLQPGEPDDMWNRYQKQYYEWLAYSKDVTVLMRLSLSKLSGVSPSLPVGFKLGNFVLGKYILKTLKYELPAPDGFVLAEFAGRQLVPKIIRATGQQDGRTVTSWIRLAIENFQIEYNGNNSRQTHYADIVAYVWKDGLFTEPETNQIFVCEYRKNSTEYDINQISTKVTSKHSVQISGHRTVVEPRVNYMITGNPIGLIKWVTWAMLDGDGYRAR